LAVNGGSICECSFFGKIYDNYANASPPKTWFIGGLSWINQSFWGTARVKFSLKIEVDYAVPLQDVFHQVANRYMVLLVRYASLTHPTFRVSA
jgi:hypothetical protein